MEKETKSLTFIRFPWKGERVGRGIVSPDLCFIRVHPWQECFEFTAPPACPPSWRGPFPRCRVCVRLRPIVVEAHEAVQSQGEKSRNASESKSWREVRERPSLLLPGSCELGDRWALRRRRWEARRYRSCSGRQFL